MEEARGGKERNPREAWRALSEEGVSTFEPLWKHILPGPEPEPERESQRHGRLSVLRW